MSDSLRLNHPSSPFNFYLSSSQTQSKEEQLDESQQKVNEVALNTELDIVNNHTTTSPNESYLAGLHEFVVVTPDDESPLAQEARSCDTNFKNIMPRAEGKKAIVNVTQSTNRGFAEEPVDDDADLLENIAATVLDEEAQEGLANNVLDEIALDDLVENMLGDVENEPEVLSDSEAKKLENDILDKKCIAFKCTIQDDGEVIGNELEHQEGIEATLRGESVAWIELGRWMLPEGFSHIKKLFAREKATVAEKKHVELLNNTPHKSFILSSSQRKLFHKFLFKILEKLLKAPKKQKSAKKMTVKNQGYQYKEKINANPKDNSEKSTNLKQKKNKVLLPVANPNKYIEANLAKKRKEDRIRYEESKMRHLEKNLKEKRFVEGKVNEEVQKKIDRDYSNKIKRIH